MAVDPTAASPTLDDTPLPQLLDELDALLGGFPLSLFEDTAGVDAAATLSPPCDDASLSSRPPDTTSTLCAPTQASEPPTDGKPPTDHVQSPKLTSRERLQLEKTCLRAQIKELETQLMRLRQQPSVGSRCQGPDLDDTAQVVLPTPVWAQIAARQAEEKRAAQAENLKLRMLLEHQLRVARSLERILVKRSVVDPPCSLFDSNKRPRIVAVPVGKLIGPLAPASAFEPLFAETDAVMKACGLAGMRMREDSDSAVVKLDDGGALFLECTLTRVLPFSPQDAAAAVWKSISGHRLEWSDGFYSTTPCDSDAFAAEYKITSQVRRTFATFHGRGVGARRAESGGNFQFVWKMTTAVTGPAFQNQRVGLRDRSYLVLEPLDALDGTNATGTLLKSCVRSWPEWEDQQRPLTNVTIDLVLTSCKRNVTTVLQTVENTLLQGASSLTRCG